MKNKLIQGPFFLNKVYVSPDEVPKSALNVWLHTFILNVIIELTIQ